MTIPFKQIEQEQEDDTDFDETWIEVGEEAHEELLKIKEELEEDD